MALLAWLLPSTMPRLAKSNEHGEFLDRVRVAPGVLNTGIPISLISLTGILFMPAPAHDHPRTVGDRSLQHASAASSPSAVLERGIVTTHGIFPLRKLIQPNRRDGVVRLPLSALGSDRRRPPAASMPPHAPWPSSSSSSPPPTAHPAQTTARAHHRARVAPSSRTTLSSHHRASIGGGRPRALRASSSSLPPRASTSEERERRRSRSSIVASSRRRVSRPTRGARRRRTRGVSGQLWSQTTGRDSSRGGRWFLGF